MSSLSLRQTSGQPEWVIFRAEMSRHITGQFGSLVPGSNGRLIGSDVSSTHARSADRRYR
jgi:hypothetical protein